MTLALSLRPFGCAAPLLVVLLGAAWATSSCTPEVDPAPEAKPTGTMPLVTWEEFQGELARRKGTPLLVNFWAIWCVPCVAELPDLVAVRGDFTAQGGEVLGVAMDLMAPQETVAGVQEKMGPFLASKGMEFPNFLLAADDTMLEGVPSALPTTLAIDREGNIVGRHEERATRADFEELAAQALGKKSGDR